MGVAALQLIQFVSIILNINMKLKHCSGAYYSFTVQKKLQNIQVKPNQIVVLECIA